MWRGSRKAIALSIAAFVVLALATHASAGASSDLDPTFGENGSVMTAFVGHSGARAVEMVGTRILVAGLVTGTRRGIAVARYLQNGHLDPAFGDGGKVVHRFFGGDFFPTAMAELPSGRFVVGGAFDRKGPPEFATVFALARFERDGRVDESFGRRGLVLADLGPGSWWLSSLIRQADGKLVAAGSRTRLTGGGSRMDSSQTDSVVARFNGNGSLDTGYGDGGRVVTPFDWTPGERGQSVFSGLALDVAGRVIAAGAVDRFGCDLRWIVARYATSGDLDPSFGGDGKVVTGFGAVNGGGLSSVEVGDDDTITVAGNFRVDPCGDDPQPGYGAVGRYLPDGHLDRAFAGDGKVFARFQGPEGSAAFFNDMTLEEGGQIATVGSVVDPSQFLGRVIVAKYLRDGSLNAAFSGDGRASATSPLGYGDGYAMFEDVDGRPVVVGDAYDAVSNKLRFLVMRFKASGAG